MRVIPIAKTMFMLASASEMGYEPHPNCFVSSADELAEAAGRNCYQSWQRPNPATATNEGYLKNILDQGHFSVLEHASITFFVDGVSRALLTELERHRFLSFSVVSQRYVRMDRDRIVVAPAIEEHGELIARKKMYVDWTIRDLFDMAVSEAFDAYDKIVETLVAEGLPKKQALEAARSVLPNATEVKMVVTGNVRAWRDVIGKRYHEAADAEIRDFASEVLKQLRIFAPNSVQDIPDTPYGD